MKKTTLIWMAVLAAIVLLVVWCVGRYNALVTEQENVEKAWGQVQTAYQGRAELVPQLVATAQGLVQGEDKVLTDVMEARAKATAITIDPTNITEENLVLFQNAQNELTQALSRLMAVREAYPELKLNEQFGKLSEQLEGIQNRVTIARREFNECAQTYNTLVRRFPTNIIASMFGFDKRPYFEADEAAQQAPKVEFKFD
ncbi:MAG: LemA family protein [Paludibacteraceae bacterium]|nr:LemA family protein [Paludibacteraceae bacterium]